METLEHANNAELLSTLAGKAAAVALLQQYGGLTSLAQASFDELQLVKGVGKSKAAAIKSAFLLAQRLAREAYPEPPVLDTPNLVADLLREENRLYTVENLQVVLLNTRRRLIAVQNVGDGDAMRVTTQIGQDCLRTRKRSFGVDHPLVTAEPPQPAGKVHRIGEARFRLGELQLPRVKELLESVAKLRAEDQRESAD